MTAVNRPHAVTATDLYLSLVLDEFEAQGEVLRQILGRLPEPPPEADPEPVKVSEPAPMLAPAEQDQKTEPEVVPVAEPALPRRPARKAQPKRR